MLSFISGETIRKVKMQDSNTSHVIIYHAYFDINEFRASFKYIPCYHLSATNSWQRDKKVIQIHPMLSFIRLISYLPISLRHSNTSHVIIYPVRSLPIPWSVSFKYIPCYHLSNMYVVNMSATEIQIHPMLSFISLSEEHAALSEYSNTSHVIIYPR